LRGQTTDGLREAGIGLTIESASRRQTIGMMPVSTNLRPAIRLWRLGIVLACLVVCGCSSTKIYTAKTLPGPWHAKPIANVTSFDLTKLSSATVPEDLIAPEDVLEVTIASGVERESIQTMPSRVNERGTVDILHVGAVKVAGLDLAEAEAQIYRACVDREIYRTPHVTVVMKRPKVNRITVLGAVQKPGVVELRSGNSDLLQALVQAEGLTKEAGSLVEIHHPGFRNQEGGSPRIAEGTDAAGNQLTAFNDAPGKTVSSHTLKVDLASLGTGVKASYDLEDGAVVRVEKRDPPALQVIGLVKKPDRYEFPLGKNMRLTDAIALAGGTSNSLADKVFIIRRRDGAEPMLVSTSIRKAKRDGSENMLLEPGDTVSIEQTPGTVALDVLNTIRMNLGGALF
jgi:polysaccharide export outer membrane protein